METGVLSNQIVIAQMIDSCDPVRAGAGDGNRGNGTSAPVKDGVAEVGVYVPSFRARYLACHSQPHECVVLKKEPWFGL
jgi:hypothetical protein